MGYYSLRDYDGFTVVPEDERYQLSQLEAEARGGNSLVNSFKMSRVGNEMSLLADEESQLRTSDDPDKQEAARLLRSRIRTLRDESGAFATAPQRYEDVHGLGDAASYVAGQVGQAVGSSIDQMATGSAMGIASGVAGLIPHPAAQAVSWGLRGAAPLEMYRQNKNLLTGEAYNEIADDPVAMQRPAQDIRDEVSQHGYRAALLDTATQLLPVGQLSGVAGKALSRIPASAKLLGSAVGEGLTETGQQYSQQQAHSVLNPERDTSGDMSELINSGLGGFIGGGAMGGIGHVGEKMWARGRTEGDGQNGDVIDLNAPDTTPTRPEVTLNPVEELRGKPGKFNDREARVALATALEGLPETNETPEDDMRTLGDRRDLLVEHLKKIRGNQAADLLTLIEAAPFESPQDRYNTLADKNFLAAVDLVKRKNKLTDADLTKSNAEEPYLEGFGEISREAVDQLDGEPPKGRRTGVVDPSSFTFATTPDMFADLKPEAGAPHGSVNDRSAANKARYEEAQQKAKLFNTRSGLVANRLWNAYTDEHGYNNEEAERDAGPAGDIQRVTYERVRHDPGAVDNIRDLTSEIMAISTVSDPTPAEERRADRLAQRLVEVIGDRAGDQLADIRRITGGSDLLRKVTDRVDHYARTDRAGLQAQFDDRDAAAQELVKLIPAEVEARLLKEHGVDLSSNKDRNDILDLMEDVADGRTSVPRIKLTKLFTRRVVDAMEGYLGNTILPRMAGVREEQIDENDSSGGMTQATNTDDVHDTEATAADFRDIAEDGADEVDAFDAEAAKNNHSKVTPEAMVYHWASTKKATVADFTKAWDRNDEGRLPKLLHPGDDKMLERVQTLAGLAAERLGDQRDRYVIGNPLAKNPIEAAGGTSAKKLMDRAGMSDDKRTQLMLEYMQQEDKSEKFDPTEANDVVKKIHFLTKIDDELTDVLVDRTSIAPSGRRLTVQEKIENRGKPLDIPLDRIMPLVPPSDAAVLQRLFDSRKDVNTRVSNETLMTTVAPIVHRAKQLALEHMKDVVPGVTEFIAKNPGAELKDFVNDYFSQRYAVVAEQPTDRDYLQLSPTEFKDMATRGAKALKSVYNDAGKDEAAQTVARAGRNVIHFESPHTPSGFASIPAHALVEWVRNGRNAHTKDKNIGEASRGSQRSQHDSYRDDLGEGISALAQNGLVTGLPWIVNANGEREDFAPGEVEGKDYKTSKAQNYFVTKTGHAIKDGWKRAGVGELPPSLDLDGISVKEYQERIGNKAYAQKKQAAADAKAKAELRAGMTPEQRDQFDRNEYAEQRIKERREEARKNKELSQDPVDVQGEEAVDEAIRVAEGSQTRKDEREHLQLMTSAMRAAADHLPGALTVKGAVNKAASVAGNVWKTYMADPEAGLARMAGYIRSIGRGKHSGDYEGQKAFREIWSDYHALEDPAPAAQRGWGHVENKEFAKRLAADNPNVDVNHLELLGEDVQDKTWNPNLVGGVDRDPKVNPRKDKALQAVQTAAQHPALVNAEANAVGGPHYALPLAAVLTPRNLEAARPQDKRLLKDMRAKVAATIQALWADGKIDGGQVRKLVNHLSGFTDATLREKQDSRVPPRPEAQIERRSAAKVTEGYIKSDAVHSFLNGLVKGGDAAVEIQDPGTGFQGGRYHTVADPVGRDKTRSLAVGGPVRGKGSTLAEREAAAREVEVKKASKVAPLLKNPPKAPAAHQPKETAKLLGADRVIAPVSTEGYAGDLGRAAQAEGKRFSPKADTDMTGKVVVVSVPGRGRGFTGVDKIIEHVKMALDRGATVLTDNEANATRAHNAEGEGVLRQALLAGGYTEAWANEHFSAWQRIGTKEPSKVAGITTVREHPDSGFRQRTIDNVAAAGVTVAIATDFTTAGERLTRNTAEAQGKYLALDFSLPADKAGLRLAETMRIKDTTTLNVAGNGIYTLVRSGHTQASVNQHVYDIIAAAHALHPITKIVSGGQTGVDIAGAVAARALGIPSVITLPKGYRQRNVNNQDVNLTNAEVRKQIVDGVEGLKNTPSSQIQAPGATTAASEGAGSQTYWARYSQNNYEVSTQGDKRFSALNAKLKDGRTIEEAYQLDVKGYRAVGDDWRLGKGKPPLKTMTAAELFGQYKALWQQWADENPGLIADLREKSAGKVLTDMFASTPVSQARALAEILNETSPAASEGVSSQNTLGAAIAKHQEYLKNPPADYTTERAAATPKADLSMHYADGHGGDHRMRPEFAGRSTMDLIESGDRTATTRTLGGFKGLKKGDVFTASGGGRSVLLRATTDPYRTSEVTPKEWSQLEGWAPSVYAKYNSAWQMRFERVNEGEKHTPSSQIQAPGATTAASKGVGSQNTLQAAIAKQQEYLKNPPENYTTERAAAIGAWAAKQLERVRERAKTDQSDELQDMIDSLRRLVKTAGEVTAADRELEEKLGPQGAVKRNAEAITEQEAAAQFDQLSKMSAPPPKHIQVTSAIKHFERTLGDKVNLILKDSFPDMKIGGADYNLATNVARIATANPWRIMRLAYHESVHGMFNTILNAKGMEATKEMLYRAASEPKMYARLKQELKGHTKALEDMENDMEERVAYMFQFWKLDMLTIDKKPETFFEKVQAVMRRVFGAVRDSEKALAILTAFDEGGLKEPSAAGQVIAKIMGQGEWHKKLLARFDAQSQALYTEVMAAHNVFRTSESATAQKLGKLFYTNPGYGADTERVNGVQEGMINRTQFKKNYYSNRINDALRPLDGPNMDRDLKTLAEALNAHTEPTSELLRTAKDAIGKILNEFRGYAKSNGLDLGKQLGADKRYWPRVYEIEKLINGKDGFVNMLLTKHGKLMQTIASTMRNSGKYPDATAQDAAEAIHQSLVDRLGVEDSKLDAERDDGVLSPYFASQNERKLEWLEDEDVAPYLSTDVTGALTQYISQGVRAVEYTRMFGERGQTLKEMLSRKGDLNFVTAEGKPVYFEEDGPILRELKEAAPEKDKDAWVERRFEDLKRASGAMEGSLGKDISAGYRKFQAGMMTFQILRLLPLMIFSSMLDPNGIRVAGGDWDDMFNAYKRGFVGLWHNWKDLFLGNPYGSREADELELAALAAGVINSDAINEERGDVHSSEYSSGMSRRVNHAFFKAIGITQWDRDMRIMATAAARKAIVNHYNNTVPEHSARWLRELGLKRSDVHLNDKGELIVSAAELMKVKKIKNAATAQKMLEPTHFAVNRWVSRAIVSPNAGLRPTRASDPHYAMFFQFKSFTYAFQETTMRYAMHEAQNGNKTAALQLLRGVPIMIAADMTKAMVTGGGSLPGYMANWTLLDWVMHGINRGGLLATGSFATDILGGNISGTLAGPSVGHAFSVAGDLLTGDVGGAITQSLPGVKQMNFMHG